MMIISIHCFLFDAPIGQFEDDVTIMNRVNKRTSLKMNRVNKQTC